MSEISIETEVSQNKPQKTLKQIVVFGDGSKSVIELCGGKLSGKGEAIEENDEAFAFQKYLHEDYVFYNVTGSSSNTPTSRWRKLQNILRLMREFQSGIHLLIFAVKKGDRITERIEHNYNIFVRGICLSLVPVVLALSHCEEEQKLGKWWEDNKPNFTSYGLTFAHIVSGCFDQREGAQEVFARLAKETYQKTKEEMPGVLLEYSLKEEEGYQPLRWGNWLRALTNNFVKIYWSADMPKNQITNVATDEPNAVAIAK